MTDIYELILEELRNGGCCHFDRFPPLYNCSIGAHLLNIHNKEKQIYLEGRRVPDLRLHVLFVAPPGGSKTFWQEQYLRGEQALLKDSGITVGFAGTMTEAGFVGTIKNNDGEVVKTPGLCQTHDFSIVGIEEFAAISESLKAEYGKPLDPALLSGLDSGWVYKNLAAGSIEYETHLTLWTGSLPPWMPVVIRTNNLIDIVPIVGANGDEVLGRSGFTKLKGLYNHPYSGNLKIINAHGSTSVVTPNHALFDKNGLLTTFETKSVEIKKLERLESKENFVDPDLAFVQGFFCAEGWLSTHYIEKPFVCQQNIEKLHKVIQKKPEFFCEPHWYEQSKCFMVRIKSEFKEPFYDCYKHGYKKVPRNILNAQSEARQAFLDGFLLGDGSKPLSIWKYEQRLSNSVLSAGVTYLAQGVPSTTLGRGPTIRVHLAKNYSRRPLTDVKSVEDLPFNDIVYDVCTEDSTFATGVGQWMIVHNTQPARFDLRGGMGRRFLFIYFIPTIKDLTDLKEARRRSKNVRFNPVMTDRIRKEIGVLKEKIKTLESITWDPELYKLYDENKFLHYEEQLFDRMVLGYWLMRGKFDHELHATLDDNLRRMLQVEAHYRDTIRRGSEFAEVLLVLREHGGSMDLFALKDELLSFGKDWRQSAALIEEMKHIRAIRQTESKIELAPQLRGEKSAPNI